MTTIKTVYDLNVAVEEIAQARELPVSRVRTTIVGVIAAQMLPDSIVLKGGLAIKMQFGEVGTRATSDLDGVFALDYESTLAELQDHFKSGWGAVPPSKRQRRQNPEAPDRVAFTGTITEKVAYDPGVKRPEYLMRPVRVTINFLGTPWGGIDLELAYPEVHRTSVPPSSLDSELVATVEEFGFGDVAPVRFLTIEMQIAQKVHALTHPFSDRAHDLVDLQLLWTDEVNLQDLKRACEDTFRYRNEHEWPPLPLRSMTADRERYLQAMQEVSIGLSEPPVKTELDDARSWLVSKLHNLT